MADDSKNNKEITVANSLRWHCVRHKNTGNCVGDCYVQNILALFGKKHTLSIIRLLLLHEKLRFNEILKEIGGSPKTITERLKELRAYGLMNRESFNEIPIRVEYSLTKQGKELDEIFERISIWTRNFMRETQKANLEEES